MSKTFESAVTESGSRTLLVSTDIGMSTGFFLEVQDKHEGSFPICFNNSTAPALMLAIGECLPPIPETVCEGSYEAFMAVALEYLGKAVRALEAETAEAEAQAKLEAEALELFRAAFPRLVEEHFLSTEQAELWLRVARRAREINMEENND